MQDYWYSPDDNCLLTIALDILDSLAFENMDHRENDLEDPWARTFEWLTPGHVDSPDGSNNDTGRQAYQDCFNMWLRSSDPQPFWICGKAGSGKSTLMKKLFHQPNFREDVQNWAGATPVAFASFYFFSRGSSLLQKSQEGMFRAVLHQIISQHRALARHIEDLVHDVSKDRQDRGSVRKIEWDWENLKKALNMIKDQAFNSRKIRLCLFLDGLDEYTAHTTSSDSAVAEGRNPTAHNSKRTRREDYKNLCQLVMDLASSTNVKICVSSRDLNQFASTFGESPKLRLEDLSRRDISTYVTGNLDTSNQWDSLRSEAPETMENIVARIIEKASGVFLWVRIVVEQIREAIEDGLYLQELTKFIENIPEQLEDLFSKMVEDINPEYRSHSATLFQLVLTSETWRPLPAATLRFAETATTKYVVSKISTSPTNERLDQIAADTELANMRQRLRSHSAGLIELARGTDIEPGSPIDPGPDVQFIHQTVNDFIENKGGLSKLFAETPGDLSRDSSVRLLRSSILGISTVHTCFIPDSIDDYHDAYHQCNHIWRFVHDAIHWARTLDSTEEDADELATLLDCLDAAGEVALGPQVNSLQHLGANHWVASEPQESGGRDYSTQDNFLSYTIQAGLENYAQRKLKTVAPKRGKPYLEYALATGISDHPLAMYRYGKSGAWDAVGVRPASPRFVKYLLDHGADPNEAWTTTEYKPHEHTVWSSALTSINFRLSGLITGGQGSPIYRIAYELAPSSQENTDRQRCIDNLTLLIEYGADVSLALDGSEGLNTPSELIKALLAAQRHNLDLSEMLETLDRAVASGLKPSCERVLAAVSGSHVARRDFRTAEGLPEQGAVISGLHPTRRLLKNVSGDPVEAKANSVTENEVAGSQSSGDESSTIARRLDLSKVTGTQQSAISSGNSNMLSPATPVSGDTSVENLSDFPVAGKSNSKGVRGWMKKQGMKLWKRLRPGKET